MRPAPLRRVVNSTKYVLVLECGHIIRIPPEKDAIRFALSKSKRPCEDCFVIPVPLDGSEGEPKP